MILLGNILHKAKLQDTPLGILIFPDLLNLKTFWTLLLQKNQDHI